MGRIRLVDWRELQDNMIVVETGCKKGDVVITLVNNK